MSSLCSWTRRGEGHGPRFVLPRNMDAAGGAGSTQQKIVLAKSMDAAGAAGLTQLGMLVINMDVAEDSAQWHGLLQVSG